jgi:hypothetical protein
MKLNKNFDVVSEDEDFGVVSEDEDFVLVPEPAPVPVLVSVPAPELDLVSVPVHRDLFIFLSDVIFRDMSCEDLLLVSKDNSLKFYKHVKCPKTIVNVIAKDLLHYAQTHRTLYLSPDEPFEIITPFFHSTHKTMTLLAVLLILHKQMEEAYEVLMIVSGTARSDTLVTALVIHMCEQNIGLNDMRQEEISELLSMCRAQSVQQEVMDFANALLHHKYK